MIKFIKGFCSFDIVHTFCYYEEVQKDIKLIARE